MIIYEDSTKGGAWHHCFCGWSGDSIALAARVWQLTQEAAILRLEALGLLPEGSCQHTATYLREYVETPARRQALWEASRQYTLRHARPALQALCARFKLQGSFDQAAWLRGPGRWIGSNDHETVEKCLYPRSWSRGGCASRRRPFVGRGWQDVLILPYQALPDYLSALWMIGRHGDPVEDVVFHLAAGVALVPAPPGATTRLREAGLFGLTSVRESRHTGGYYLAVSDPLLAARLQVRHYSGSLSPLPLVAWYDGPKARTHRTWQVLDQHTPVLWGWDLSASLLNQAIQSNGLLSLTPLRDARDARDRFIRSLAPGLLLHKLFKRAVPWRDAVRTWAAQATPEAADDLLFNLEKYSLEEPVLAEVRKLLPMAQHRPQARQVRVDNCTIVERGGQWFINARGHETLIMDATLHIAAVFIEHGKVQCKGVLTHHGKEIPFLLPERKLRKDIIEQLNQLAITHDTGVLYTSKGADRVLYQAALLFSNGGRLAS